MDAGIVGLPNVGKSTLFNALTAAGIASENYPFCTIEPNVGVVEVPDPRLDRIAAHVATRKIVPASLRLVDIAGLVRGASEGQGLGNQFLSHIRGVDAIIHVVRCFEDPDIAHVEGSVDPIRDIETIETELMLADMATVEGALDKARRQARSGDKEAKVRTSVLERCAEALAAERPIRALDFELPEERAALRSLAPLTARRVLYAANVEEDDLLGEGERVSRVRARAAAEGGEVVAVCARLEAELAELEGEEKAEMLEAMGLEEPALGVLARAAYRLLGLESFFTAGPEEIRAWTIPAGSRAPQAAGVIHGDFERGFIRAEVHSVEDLEQYGSEKAVRDAGRLRTEGKEYIVRDGDICHFLTSA